MDLLEQLQRLVPALEERLDKVTSAQELEHCRVEFLGRKGKVAELMSRLPELPPAERPVFGQTANKVKQALTELLEQRLARQEAEREAAFLARFDAGLPGRMPWRGSLHPITLAMEEVCSVFRSMGYEIVTGPEVDTDFHCFEALNMPPEHPARDMQDTLYIEDKVVLRTHTSTMQVRTMLSRKPPLAVIAPGKVYRRDSDVTHTPMFHQIEGLLVDKKVTMTDLRGTLTAPCSGKTRACASAPAFSPLPSPVWKWICPVRSAAAKAASMAKPAGYARDRAGWKFWAVAWWTRRCLSPWGTTRIKSRALPLAWVWNVLPCSSTASAICA